MKEKKNNLKDLEKSDKKKSKTKSIPTRMKVNLSIWCFENPVQTLQKGQKLRIETSVPAVIHWSADEWKTIKDTPTRENSQGKHFADLSGNKQRESILFTFYWPDAQHWENRDFEVQIVDD